MSILIMHLIYNVTFLMVWYWEIRVICPLLVCIVYWSLFRLTLSWVCI